MTKYYHEKLSFDNAAQHSCFIRKEIFMYCKNNLFAEHVIYKQRKHQLFRIIKHL